jgi:hypothetical protein
MRPSRKIQLMSMILDERTLGCYILDACDIIFSDNEGGARSATLNTHG